MDEKKVNEFTIADYSGNNNNNSAYVKDEDGLSKQNDIGSKFTHL